MNIFANIPTSLADELHERLAGSDDVEILRIVSDGHASDPDFWYDQNRNEWILLLKGRARLLFEDDKSLMEMKPGDFVDIPAHKRHRVEWTDPEQQTVWLAVYY